MVLYLNLGLYRILVYSWLVLDRIHCNINPPKKGFSIKKRNFDNCFCACTKPWHGMLFFALFLFFFWASNNLKWEVAFRFVDIGGIVDHHCLNFLLIYLFALCFFSHNSKSFEFPSLYYYYFQYIYQHLYYPFLFCLFFVCVWILFTLNHEDLLWTGCPFLVHETDVTAGFALTSQLNDPISPNSIERSL